MGRFRTLTDCGLNTTATVTSSDPRVILSQAEKARQKELESRNEGEFKKELGSFVEEGKLKKVGAKGLAGWSVAMSEDGSTALIGAPAA